jgi:hypothetical protein
MKTPDEYLEELKKIELQAEIRRRQYQYQKLEKMIFEDHALKTTSLRQLAIVSGYSYPKALECYSHMLKYHNNNIPEPELCPSCHQPKTLKTGNACRDYFHIV